MSSRDEHQRIAREKFERDQEESRNRGAEALLLRRRRAKEYYFNHETMTVGQLIAELSKMPADAPVAAYSHDEYERVTIVGIADGEDPELPAGTVIIN